MKQNIKILTVLTIFLIEIELVNSMEEAPAIIREKGHEHVQQIELPNNAPKNPELINSSNSNSGPLKININIDELPNAETEIRFYRQRTGSTTAEKITIKALNDLKNEIEKIDTTVVYFNNQIKNKISEEALGATNVSTKIT